MGEAAEMSGELPAGPTFPCRQPGQLLEALLKTGKPVVMVLSPAVR